ncbi:MAG: zinc-ribbon domain-containing protein, partial [Patescibacteria group bacterium]|nr:zinc-ribbon domain-containing protein [Patescibacteria group bacterium]
PADQVVAGTNKKLKWVCKKCGYRWESMGSNRVAGKSCRACANHIVKPDKSNSLARMYPELLEDYADDNEQLPDEVVAHTSAKLKWKCHTCGYRWVVPGNKRARGDGCRACDNKAVKPDKSNSLAYLYPDLFAEYAPENDLPADEVVAETEKKLKWVCKKCAYPWEAVGSSRIRGHGCPLCGIKKARETRRRNRVK